MRDAALRIATVEGAVVVIVDVDRVVRDATRRPIARILGAFVGVVDLHGLVRRAAHRIAAVDRARVAVVNDRRRARHTASVSVAARDAVAHVCVVATRRLGNECRHTFGGLARFGRARIFIVAIVVDRAFLDLEIFRTLPRLRRVATTAVAERHRARNRDDEQRPRANSTNRHGPAC